MYLHELRPPIVLQSSVGLASFREGQSLYPRYGEVDVVLSGVLDNDIFYDTSGGVYETERFLLKSPSLLDRVTKLASYTFVAMPKRKVHFARVDREIRRVENLTMRQFCGRMQEFYMRHRLWWDRSLAESDFENLFEGCNSIETAIDRVVRIDAPGLPKAPQGGSTKVVDLRTRKQPTWF
jgi:hypothetical protein